MPGARYKGYCLPVIRGSRPGGLRGGPEPVDKEEKTMFPTRMKRTAGAVTLGALLVTGAAVPSSAAPRTVTSTAVVVSTSSAPSAVSTAVPTVTSLTGATSAVQTTTSLATQAPSAPTHGTQGLGSVLLKFIQAALKFLGKSWTWLKNIVKAGYSAFLNHFWNKIPGWVKILLNGAWTAWEVYQALRDYFF